MNPEPSDPVTHAELQQELARFRSAIALIAQCLDSHISRVNIRRLLDFLAPPYDR